MPQNKKTKAINAKLAVKHWNEYKFIEAFSFACKADANDPVMMRIMGYGYLYGSGTEVDEEKGRALLETAMNMGDAEAKAEIGSLYKDGIAGYPQDYDYAAKCFKEAAEGGSGFAAFQLGCMYRDGLITGEEDYEQAVKWFEKGAEYGCCEAFVDLASCYYDGAGVEQDFGKAFGLYEKASMRNNNIALNMSGWMCEHGEGREIDMGLAIQYYEKAAELGNEDAKTNLDNLRNSLGDTVRVLEDAMQGDVQAEFDIAYWYYHGTNNLPMDYKAARKWNEAAVAAGNDNAMFNLGWMLWEGKGGSVDRKRAIELWKTSAGMGFLQSLNALGKAYQDEEFRDDAKALSCLEESAEKGLAWSMRDLGWLYENGIIVEKCQEKACEWYLRAAMKGDATAQWNLACMKENGDGVEMNLEEAEKWFLAAARQDYPEANEACLRVRRRIKLERGNASAPHVDEKRASEETIIENVRLAKAAFLKKDYLSAFKYALHGDHEDKEIQFIVGDSLLNGRGVRKMEEEAVAWLTKAADAGHPEAQAELASMYHDAVCVGQDYAKAFELFGCSSSSGCLSGMMGLGKMLLAGEGCDKDVERGVSLFRAAADAGNVDAMKLLGKAYVDGDLVPKNVVEGCRFYEMAADKGDGYSHERLGELYSHIEYGILDYGKAVSHFSSGAELGNMTSMFNLGVMYENGHGVKKDVVKASEWYTKAEAAGFAKATDVLKRLSYSNALYVADRQQNTPYQAFISYRRKGGREYARTLYLELRYRGIKTFFDYTSLQHGDFSNDILKAIEEAPNFIIMVTDGAFERCADGNDWVRKEIEYAKKLGKNIVPVAPTGHQQDLSLLPESLADIRRRQVFRLDMENLFEESVGKIVVQCLKGV